MKVVCVNNRNSYTQINSNLTINKVYDVVGEDDDEYRIINNDLYPIWYSKSRFVLLSEVREEKFKQLGI